MNTHEISVRFKVAYKGNLDKVELEKTIKNFLTNSRISDAYLDCIWECCDGEIVDFEFEMETQSDS